jgi:Uma2 family endonuclease
MTAILLTSTEYIESGDSRPRWTQLIDGEVIVNSPTIRHQKIVSYIHFEFMLWLRSSSGSGTSPGQIDVRFDDKNVLAPDVLWFAEGRMPADGTHFDGAPDVVVEVRSPSTWRYDTTVKFRKYESLGVREVWLVDTASNTVLVYRRSMPEVGTFDVALELGSGDVLTSPILVDFSLDIAALFDQ